MVLIKLYYRFEIRRPHHLCKQTIYVYNIYIYIYIYTYIYIYNLTIRRHLQCVTGPAKISHVRQKISECFSGLSSEIYGNGIPYSE